MENVRGSKPFKFKRKSNIKSSLFGPWGPRAPILGPQGPPFGGGVERCHFGQESPQFGPESGHFAQFLDEGVQKPRFVCHLEANMGECCGFFGIPKSHFAKAPHFFTYLVHFRKSLPRFFTFSKMPQQIEIYPLLIPKP